MVRYVLDSWAWIEHLRGSDAGAKVREAILDERNVILTSAVTVTEVISKFSREGLGTTEQVYSAMANSSRLVSLAPDDAKEAGVVHASTKKRRPNFSLGDAVVLHLARKEKARVLTGDPDFRGLDEAVML
jgi:PIN domain nuclease of toxin-antitoxin system